MNKQDEQNTQNIKWFPLGISIFMCIILTIFLLYFISLFVLLPWHDALSIIYISIRDGLRFIITQTTYPFIILILGIGILMILWYKIKVIKVKCGNSEVEVRSGSQTIKYKNPGAKYE